MEAFHQEIAIDWVNLFLANNSINGPLQTNQYFGKFNSFCRKPKKYEHYKLLKPKQISIKLDILEIINEVNQVKMISQLFEYILGYYGKIKNIKLILPSKILENQPNVNNLLMMSKVLRYLQKKKALINIILHINRKLYFYFEGNNYFCLNKITQHLSYDGITFIDDEEYFDSPYFDVTTNVLITDNFKSFLKKQKNITIFSIKGKKHYRTWNDSKFVTEFLFQIINDIPDNVTIFKFDVALFYNGHKTKDIINFLYKISKFPNLKINKNIFPLFSLSNFSNDVENLEIYFCGDDYSLYNDDFYNNINNYSWDNFKNIQSLVLNHNNKDAQQDDTNQYDKFLNLESVLVPSITFKTSIHDQDESLKWINNIKINQGVQEIKIIVKKPFKSFDEMNNHKQNLQEKIAEINEGINFSIISGNILSNKPLVHYEKKVYSDFYNLLFAIELSRLKEKKNYLKILYKYPILRTLKSFFQNTVCQFDIYFKK